MTTTATIAPPDLDELRVNTLRFLAVQKARSGHPGLPPRLRQFKENS